jgi:site-specific DNA recombinase
MSYGHSRGRGGVYGYFFCLSRHTGRTDCDLPYAGVEKLEQEVRALWKQTRFTATFVDQVRQQLLDELCHTDTDNQKLLDTQRRPRRFQRRPG